MRFIRFATLTFQPPAREPWKAWSLQSGSVRVESLGSVVHEGTLIVVVAAEMGMRWRPKATRDRLVVVPDKARRQAEEAIETVANLIAVAERCKRTISSPLPSVAFMAEDAEERMWLESNSGILLQDGSSVSSVSQKFDVSILDSLADRPDGVALMAEALSHDHPTGQFHEYLRVFERAFRLSSRKLVDPLSTFLAKTSFEYTRDEVSHWLVDVRHPVTHADQGQSFVLEAQVRPIIRRVEQATYDVLFNKADWRSPSSQRRAVWIPECGTTSQDHSMFIIQYRTPTMEFQLLDAFRAYPIDLRGVVVPIPEGAWIGQQASSGEAASISSEMGVEIVPSDA